MSRWQSERTQVAEERVPLKVYLGFWLLCLANYPYLWVACWLLELPTLTTGQLFQALMRNELIRTRGIRELALGQEFLETYFKEEVPGGDR